MKRVLIITYYWPPSGGAGVQRWLKFTKYLPQFGWEPIVYTPLNPDFGIIDNSLSQDISPNLKILKNKIWEPYEIYKFFIGKQKQKINVSFSEGSKKKGYIHKVALTLRGNLLIPDPRCFWISPSVKFLKKHIEKYPVDAIITTGPPHSMHVIGKRLHESTNIPWLADFRDPWTNIDFYKELNLSRVADSIHHKLEKNILQTANTVISVTPTWCRELSEISGREVKLVHNGYDDEDIIKTNKPSDSKFSLVHIGSLNSARNPHTLWKALSELVKENSTFATQLKIKFIGNVEPVVIDKLAEYQLSKYVEMLGYMTHSEAIAYQQTSTILLLLINNTPNANGILTGKFYEYMASERPILLIGPTHSDSATLLKETESGTIVGFDDFIETKKAISKLFSDFQNGKLNATSKNYQQYSRKNQCKIMAQMLDNMTPTNY